MNDLRIEEGAQSVLPNKKDKKPIAWVERLNAEVMPETPVARRVAWLAFWLAVSVVIMLVLALVSFVFAILAASGALAVLGFKLVLAAILVALLTAGVVGITALFVEAKI